MLRQKPLCIELFAGRFGWGRGAVAAGYRVVGFDLIHESYHGDVPAGCELVLQDVLTLHGSQFKNASLILASPPCQKYSYMAMPWERSKLIAEQVHRSKTELRSLNRLFQICFHIQQQANRNSDHYIPLVVENVIGAQPWVGKAVTHFGSYYLWGDVPTLLPSTEIDGDNRHSLKGATFGWFNDHKRKGVTIRKSDRISYSWSSSKERKETSARTAEIPFNLAAYIAWWHFPEGRKYGKRPNHIAGTRWRVPLVCIGHIPHLGAL